MGFSEAHDTFAPGLLRAYRPFSVTLCAIQGFTLSVTLSRLSCSTSGRCPCNLCATYIQVLSCPRAIKSEALWIVPSPVVTPQRIGLSQAYAR